MMRRKRNVYLSEYPTGPLEYLFLCFALAFLAPELPYFYSGCLTLRL